MKYLFIFLFITQIFSKNFKDMNLIELYNNHYYTYICMNRWKYINKYKRDEKILSLVAYSCLKKHFLTPALDLSKVLRFTKLGRNNALYINELFRIKLLLIQFILDKIDLNKFQEPIIDDDLLARVFFLAKSQRSNIKENSFKVKDKDYSYIVRYIIEINNIVIEIYKDNKLIKKVKYW